MLAPPKGEDQASRRDGHLHEGLADRGQGRADPLRDGQVVEADDAEVLGDVQACLAGGLVDPERLEIVAGEDRRRAIRHPQQGPALGDPLLDVERSAAEEARVDRHTGLVHRGPVAVEASAAAQDLFRPADHADSAMSEAQQVARRRQASVPVRGADRGDVVEGLAGWIDDDQRDAPRPELRAHRLVEVREDGDHAAGPPGEDALDPAPSRGVATLHLGQDDREVVLAGHLLHSQQDLEGPGALELVEEHLDERGAMDGPVGSLVAAIPDDRLDAPPRLGGDVGPAVDHLGDRGRRDARLLGDRRDRHPPAGLARRARDHVESISKVSAIVSGECRSRFGRVLTRDSGARRVAASKAVDWRTESFDAEEALMRAAGTAPRILAQPESHGPQGARRPKVVLARRHPRSPSS